MAQRDLFDSLIREYYCCDEEATHSDLPDFLRSQGLASIYDLVDRHAENNEGE